MRRASLVPALVPDHRRGIAVALATLALAVACGGAAESPAEASMGAGEAKVDGFAADAVAAPELARGLATRAAVDAPAPPPAPAQGGADSAISTMLIRTGHVAVRVDSLEPAMARLQQLAASLGGTVGNVSINAEVAHFDMLTAHADQHELLGWLEHDDAPRHTFLVHGEPAAADALRRAIAEQLRWPVSVPDYRDTVDVHAL